MSDFYIEWRKNENLKPLSLPNKEQYYRDLTNIEHSWSGRIDTNIGNTFIMEAEQQLINAMELFEAGYFDCAYYSLRSAVDMSTTMVFLTDLPEEEREKYLAAWKDTADFPVQGRMVKQLIDNGDIFSDMYKKMPDFFSNAKNLSADLNKYVHKQGFQHFYISRNHTMNQDKSQDVFIKNFQNYLEKCFGVVAVMRLAFDPFPVLLMDEEILYRCFDSMTEPYSEKFVEKYIGESVINEYKNNVDIRSSLNYFPNFVNKDSNTPVNVKFRVRKPHKTAVLRIKSGDNVILKRPLLGPVPSVMFNIPLTIDKIRDFDNVEVCVTDE